MGTFKSGDRVADRHGNEAVVLESFEALLVELGDGGIATVQAKGLVHAARKFKVGAFVRITADDETNGEVGIVYEDDGSDEYSDPYRVALFDELGSDEWYSANEMTPWLPTVGERVIEAGVENDVGGTVVSANDGVANVLWDTFPHPQPWKFSELEPEDQYEENDTLRPGDEVEYTNPMFSGTSKAKVISIDGEAVNVKFDSGPMRDGVYHREFFTKAA